MPRFSLTLAFAATFSATLMACLQVPLSAQELSAKPSPFIVEKPRWEVGVGAAAVQLEAYPASSESNTQSIALPFFIYRGNRVRMQDGGIQAVAVENNRYTLDLSIGAALNVNSEDVTVRTGMPDLDFLFELGPKLQVRLWEKRNYDNGQHQNLTMDAAVRGAFSTDFSSIDSRGYVLNLQLEYERKGFITPNTKLYIGGGPLWVTDELADYIYGVRPEFSLPNRAPYSGRSGYLGTNITAGITTKFFRDTVRVFAAIGTGFHNSSANSDSPLFEEDFTTGVALGIAWTLKSSADTISIFE